MGVLPACFSVCRVCAPQRLSDHWSHRLYCKSYGTRDCTWVFCKNSRELLTSWPSLSLGINDIVVSVTDMLPSSVVSDNLMPSVILSLCSLLLYSPKFTSGSSVDTSREILYDLVIHCILSLCHILCMCYLNYFSGALWTTAAFVL